MAEDNISPQEIFNCPICLEQVNIPKYLPCLHTFCQACLQTYISSTTAHQEEKQSFECPVCRRETFSPEPNISSERWAESFPLNHLIMSMSVSLKKITKTCCAICKRSEKDTVAKHWCIQCEDPVCEDCKSYHMYVKVLSGHKIIHLTDVNDSTNVQLPDIEEPCDLHKGKFIEVYCKDHKKICCSICFATQHRKCESVESLDDIAKNLDKTEIEASLKSLTEISDKLTCVQNSKKKLIEILQKEKEEILSSTSLELEEAISLLNTLYRQWRKNFELQHDQHTVENESVANDFKQFQTTITDAKRILSVVLERGSPRQLFIADKKVRQQIKDHFERLHTTMTTKTVCGYQYACTDILTQVSVNGKLEEVTVSSKSSEDIQEISDYVYAFCDACFESDRDIDFMTCKINKVSEFEFRSGGSVAYAMFFDENVITTNRTAKIFIYNFTGTLLHTKTFSETAYGLRMGKHSDEVDIAFRNRIRRFKVQKEWGFVFLSESVVKDVEDFAYVGQSIVSAGENSKVVITTNGTTKHTFRYSRNGGHAGYISTSTNSNKMAYINDEEIVCRKLDGTEEFTVNVGFDSRGIAFDRHDNLYVGFYGCTNLTQISADRKRRRDISVGHEAYNVVFHPKEKLFLIMSWYRCSIFKFES